MLKKYEIMIALRYLRSKRKEGFISIVSAFSFLGIALGVATLIIVMSVMNGYETELISRILGINGHITITSPYGKIEDYKSISKKISNLKGVKFTAPLINEQAMVTSIYSSSGAMVRGMDAIDIKKKPLVNSSIKVGSIEDYILGEGLLIGTTLAQRLRVNVGDTIKIIVPKSDSTIIGAIPRMKTFKVVGLFDVGMYEYNSSTIFMPLNSAQKLFQLYDAVNEIEVVKHKKADIKLLKSDIAEAINQPINLTDWSMVNQNLVNALKVERNVMFLILTLIIIVAAFNIISSLIMLVKEKTKNIAILRTIGMSRSSIIKIFILSGSIIGIMGTILGCVLGVLFSLNIEKIRAFLQSTTGTTLFDPVVYFLTQLPSELDVASVFVVAGMSLVLSFLATIYPAWKAATLMPAEALRYE